MEDSLAKDVLRLDERGVNQLDRYGQQLLYLGFCLSQEKGNYLASLKLRFILELCNNELVIVVVVLLVLMSSENHSHCHCLISIVIAKESAERSQDRDQEPLCLALQLSERGCRTAP